MFATPLVAVLAAVNVIGTGAMNTPLVNVDVIKGAILLRQPPRRIGQVRVGVELPEGVDRVVDDKLQLRFPGHWLAVWH